MFTGREHVFRSLNGGVNPNFPYAKVKEHCNLWIGTATSTRTAPTSRRSTSATTGRRWAIPATSAGSPTARRRPVRRRRTPPPRGRWPAPRRTRGATTAPAATSRINTPSPSDTNVVWAATSAGRIFVTTNAGCGRPGHDHLAPDRPDVVGRPAAVPDGHLRRPVGPEPRVHHVQRLQPRDAGHAGSRLRRRVQPGNGRRDVHEPRRHRTARARRPAGRDDRAGRDEGRALRRHGLRRRAAGERRTRVGRRRSRACRRRPSRTWRSTSSTASCTSRRTASAPGR